MQVTTHNTTSLQDQQSEVHTRMTSYNLKLRGLLYICMLLPTLPTDIPINPSLSKQKTPCQKKGLSGQKIKNSMCPQDKVKRTMVHKHATSALSSAITKKWINTEYGGLDKIHGFL